ncbi:MAG TPA: branched-chain amino acid ABC transporter permease [Chloroflexota bacterium]|nr:branched-chain amino acid ABC transporter permease [Chloroflexota bacterium]
MAPEFLADLWATYQSLVYFLGINAILALSVYVTLAGGQLSMAQAAFMGIGAYAAALLTLNLQAPFPVALAAGAVLPALIALPLGIPALRLHGVFLAIATIGFGEVVRILVLNLPITGGALGLNAIPNKTRLWHILLVLAVAVFCFWRLRGSRAGYAVEAIREDETAARALGINVAAYKVWAFVAGAVLAGTAGGLSAHFTFFIGPNEFGFDRAVTILLYAIVGGVTAFWGPLAGAALLSLLPEILRGLGVQAGAVRLFVNGAILVAVILFAPNGLVGLARRLQRRGAPVGPGHQAARPPSVSAARKVV